MSQQQPVGAELSAREVTMLFIKMMNNPQSAREAAEILAGYPISARQIGFLAADAQARCGPAVDGDPAGAFRMARYER